MYHVLEFLHLEHGDDILDIYFQMLQALLVVTPPSKLYNVSNVLFHKYRGANVASKGLCEIG